MVEETIETIRRAEAEAESIVREAEQKCEQILTEAKETAQQKKASGSAASKAHSDACMEAARENGTKAQSEAAEIIEREVAALKELASQKEEAAIDMVLSKLIQ